MDDDLDLDLDLDLFSISQLQQQIMAAKTLESDHDLAYRIQLQEALSASLLHHQPSSSSSSPLLQNPSIPTSLSLKPESQPGPEPDGDISIVMKLQALELDRYQQERRDREICDAEMRRIAADIKRRAHDQSFAREIDIMGEEDWDEYGDNFERPIDAAGCSSSSAASDLPIGKPFRLYFKGLVCEEEMKGKLVSLAAIGIAVCDPHDELLLKIQKPLAGAGLSRGVVEWKALIEGLNAVVSLDIKNVDVYCDYVPLYNQITGKWAVKQRKIANLINQVYPLKRKLEKCQMHLLPRCHVKFAFKLAREAIDSQMTRTIEADDKNLKETCTICLEDNDVSQIFVVDGCLHRYCFSCMKQHVEVKLFQGVLPGCPTDRCLTKLNVDNSRKFLPPRLIEIMAQRIREASIPETDRLYCPYPKCSALMSKREMMHNQDETSSTYPEKFKSGISKCVKCDGLFCLNCRVPWHRNMSCSDYKKSNPFPRAEDAKLQSLAKQNLWRQCIKCKHMIELAEGCYHMTCRCGYEFCYTCGAQWISKKATCSCPLWDEENIWFDHDDDSDDDFDAEEDEDSESDEYEFLPRRYFLGPNFRIYGN